jgi:hypothetical protein
MVIIMRGERVHVDLTILGESRTHYRVKFEQPVRLRGRFVEVGQAVAVLKRAVLLQAAE